MSVLIYNKRMTWKQKRVVAKEVIKYLMNGWAIAPYSGIEIKK